MRKRAARIADASSRSEKISFQGGPTAMSEQANEYGPVATRMIFDNDDVRVWEMDLAPGGVCGLHHHTMDYVLFILSGANVGAQSPGGRKMMPFPVKARATYFVPAGGVESAHNMGDTRFFEALFELKRPAKPGREKLGFVGCEAVAGKEPEPGTITILDNARVRVSETTLAPGGQSGVRRWSHDTAVYVAEGGLVKIVECAGDGSEHSLEESHSAGRVLWFSRGTHCGVVNVGTERYRQIAVELK
jgi:predicted metal-dependent enzyme (double-stranded beta helix superfamily)